MIGLDCKHTVLIVAVKSVGMVINLLVVVVVEIDDEVVVGHLFVGEVVVVAVDLVLANWMLG